MELGSEYNLCLNDLNIVGNNIFTYLSDFEQSNFFDSGRSALKFLVNQLNQFTKVLLPEYI